jgi:hypothetical protein
MESITVWVFWGREELIIPASNQPHGLQWNKKERSKVQIFKICSKPFSSAVYI